jgi:hypothetical protein
MGVEHREDPLIVAALRPHIGKHTASIGVSYEYQLAVRSVCTTAIMTTAIMFGSRDKEIESKQRIV